jgi:quinol monooxygenase YgiN
VPVVIAVISALPEHRSTVREALLAAVPQVHGEDGCGLYALHENDDSFVMIERWATPQALGVHAKAPAFTALAASLDGRLAAPLQIISVEALPAGDPAKGTLGG